jgi:hypothetical protein
MSEEYYGSDYEDDYGEDEGLYLPEENGSQVYDYDDYIEQSKQITPMPVFGEAYEGSYDPILFRILLNMGYNDIMNQCKINKRARSICNSEFFWTEKLAYFSDEEKIDLYLKLLARHNYGIIFKVLSQDPVIKREYY